MLGISEKNTVTAVLRSIWPTVAAHIIYHLNIFKANSDGMEVIQVVAGIHMVNKECKVDINLSILVKGYTYKNK